MISKAFRLTEQGIAELETELQHCIAERSNIAERIKTAREFGDLSENAEYQIARQEQEKNDSRISEIEHILANVEVIKAPNGDSKVQLGSKVTLKDGGGKTKEFQVVGTVEADPLEGKISDESPIGQALLGKAVGDDVEIKTPASVTTYVVSHIG